MTRFLVLAALVLALAACGAEAEEPDPAAPADEPAAAAAVPATAVLVCSPEGAAVETRQVAASRDGVHVELRNESGAEQIVHVAAGDSSQGEGFPEGAHTRVWDLPPGPATVSCADPEDTSGAGAAAPFEIVDPESVWVPTAIDCDGEVTTSTLDYFAGAPGLQGEPGEVVRASGEGGVQIEARDVVERAGYPEAGDAPVVRVVRDGRTVATVTLMPSDDGGWLVSTVSACARR